MENKDITKTYHIPVEALFTDNTHKIGYKNRHGITLIALVITIIILLILAGIVINLTIGENGIIKRAQQAGINYNEASAREKLELALVDLQADKVVNSAYNNSTYIDNYLTKKQMTVNGNIVTVGKWQFEIDRSIPKIATSLGEEVDDTITDLSLDKEEIIIGITQQANINIDNTAQIKVTTEGISGNKYKWNIKDNNIATIDENGNITAIAGGTTTIECKSTNGNKTYATCNLIVEEREYLYYKGNSIVSFDDPLYGSQCTVLGAPYFMNGYIYFKMSNNNYTNASQLLSILTKDKIDFSSYKGIGIKLDVNITGIGSSNYSVYQEQTKTCNNWGGTEATISSSGEEIAIPRIDESQYFDFRQYNYTDEAYLNIVFYTGQYLSGIASETEVYIYEIYLVK